MKRKHWLLLAAMVVATLALSGCGVGGGDLSDPPSNLWQTLVVWPLGHTLSWIDTRLQALNVPYHWGFAIILFTLFIKLVTLPLTLTQIRGMEAQKRIQPKVQELQKKYGKDREKLAAAQMELYKEAGVNPLSGCLPLLVQMPILFGLYSAIVVIGPRLQNASFFWIPDLGFPEYTGGMGWILENFNNGNYSFLAAYLVLPLLLVASQFISQRWMTPPPAPGNDQAGMMRQVGLMMVFMFGFFTLQVPAGLTLYWVTSNLLQMLQQFVIMGRQRDQLALAGAADSGTVTVIDSEPNGSGPGSGSTNGSGSRGGLGGFFDSLAEAATKAAEERKAQQNGDARRGAANNGTNQVDGEVVNGTGQSTKSKVTKPSRKRRKKRRTK